MVIYFLKIKKKFGGGVSFLFFEWRKIVSPFNNLCDKNLKKCGGAKFLKNDNSTSFKMEVCYMKSSFMQSKSRNVYQRVMIINHHPNTRERE